MGNYHKEILLSNFIFFIFKGGWAHRPQAAVIFLQQCCINNVTPTTCCVNHFLREN